MSPRALSPALAAALAAGLLVVGPAAPAGANAACSIVEQVTQTTGGSNNSVAIDGDGDRVAFVSNRDLTGDNADLNQEIVVADLDAGTFTQVTETTGAIPGNSQPSIDDAGTKVTFVSAGDLVGTSPEELDQVFLWNGTAISQLTFDAPGEAHDPAISGDGTDVAYRSNGNPTGGNADGNDEIFVVNTSGPPAPLRLTAGVTGASRRPSVDDTGARVAFESTGDLVPSVGNTDGSNEVFVVDRAGPVLVQLSAGDLDHPSSRPRLAEDGTTVVYQSQANAAGHNADGNLEIVRRALSSSTSSQVTQTLAGGNSVPTTTQTAARTLYISDSVDNPRATDATRQVMVDDGAGEPTHVTAERDLRHAAEVVVSDDGRVAAVASTADPFGTNGDHNQEVFVARCGPIPPTFTDVPSSNAFFGQVQWMAELGIASGFPGPTFRPLDGVKRQQMANFLYNLAGRPEFDAPVTPTFVDVPASNPFFAQVEWMVAEGIASGFAGNRFKPNDVVKRQQMANFLYNLAGQPLFAAPGSPSFVDVPTGNPFFLQVEWMFAESVANGFPGNRFKPNDPVKRQQMANFVHAFAVRPGVHLD